MLFRPSRSFRRRASWLPGWLLVLLAALLAASCQAAAGAPPLADPATPASTAVAATVAATPEVAGATPTALAAAMAVADSPADSPLLEPTTRTPAPPVAESTPITTLVAAKPAAPATTVASPTPAAPVGPPRIGLQVGHWRAEELPDDLARLRGATGGAGGGVREVDMNLEVAERLSERLQARGYAVDLLPATVPPGYRADAFLAIHADASTSAGPRGYKLARSRWSRLPLTDDALLRVVRAEYGRATGLPWSDSVTRNMTGYYSFNNRRRANAIDKQTPAAIVEMGYLTNPIDRQFMLGQTEQVVAGLERGLVRFLEERPPPAEREQPATTGLTIVINEGGATARSAPSLGATALATLKGGQRQEAPEIQGEWYGIWVAAVNGPGWVHRSQATLVTVTLP